MISFHVATHNMYKLHPITKVISLLLHDTELEPCKVKCSI